MVWKPKEKELTKEEAIALAKQELTPYWSNRTPFLAATTTDDGSSLYGLDPIFEKQDWTIFFIDPMTTGVEKQLIYFSELQKRYSEYDIGFLVMLLNKFNFIKKEFFIQNLCEKYRIEYPLVVDHDGGMQKALGLIEFPVVYFFQNSKLIWSISGEEIFENLEDRLQKLLRKKDPGLPLSPLFVFEQSMPKQIAFYDFGKKGGDIWAKKRSDVSSKKIFLSGKWSQDDEKIFTSDPKAQLIIQTQGVGASLIVESLSSERVLPAQVIVELNGAPVLEIFSGEDLESTDGAASVLKVMDGGMYQILSGLTGENQEITLSFDEANLHPVGLYGIRFFK